MNTMLSLSGIENASEQEEVSVKCSAGELGVAWCSKGE
jgi:hypothetical protein